ncbi:MAG TPA: GNAT family N-acetyltransferase [Kofleriaceae bacterium]|nr:GNAT family N-acetyltransferase [Kofleriaceae bacterium]
MIEFHVPEQCEAATLAALGRATFVSTFGHLYSPENLATFLATAYSEDVVGAELANPQLLWSVAVDSEAPAQPIGFCKLSLTTALPCNFGTRRVIEFKQLYLLAPYHGRGIADDFMRWALKQAESRGFDDMILCVFSENLRAQRFYQRYGFVKYMDYHFMVGDQCDHEFLFHKPLRG